MPLPPWNAYAPVRGTRVHALLEYLRARVAIRVAAAIGSQALRTLKHFVITETVHERARSRSLRYSRAHAVNLYNYSSIILE